MRSLIALSVTLTLTACAAVGPDYVAPTVDVPPAFDDQAAERVTPEQIASWWDTFGDEQLSRLVADVLASNLDIAAAVQRVEFSRATYGIAAADRRPTVDATAGYSRARPFGGRTTDQWTVGSRVSWEIDVFGRVRRSIEAAVANFEADVEELHDVQVALAAETVSVYFQALSFGERLRLADRNVAGQERSLDIAQRRFDAGMSAGLDPAQARVNLHTTQAAIPGLELQLRGALHRLAVLAGRDPRALIATTDTSASLPTLPSQLMVGIPADLLRNRPDIRSLERRLAAQTAQVGVATAALYPSINLTGSWDSLARDPSGLFENGTGFGSLGPLATLPVFNAGRLRSQVNAEEAALRDLDLQLRQRVLLAQEEVENSLVAVVRDQRQTELLQDAVDAARQSVGFARELYTSGQSDFQNVLDAERSLFSLEDDLALSSLNAMLDVVDLYRSIGGGWKSGAHDVEPKP